jgi:hypothetical protein
MRVRADCDRKRRDQRDDESVVKEYRQRRRVLLQKNPRRPAEGRHVHHNQPQKFSERESADREIEAPQAKQRGRDKRRQRSSGSRATSQNQRQRDVEGVREPKSDISPEANKTGRAERNQTR